MFSPPAANYTSSNMLRNLLTDQLIVFSEEKGVQEIQRYAKNTWSYRQPFDEPPSTALRFSHHDMPARGNDVMEGELLQHQLGQQERGERRAAKRTNTPTPMELPQAGNRGRWMKYFSYAACVLHHSSYDHTYTQQHTTRPWCSLNLYNLPLSPSFQVSAWS